MSLGTITTRSTPSSVRQICCSIVTRPWPTSAAAVCTVTTGSPRDDLEPHPGGRVVVEALGEADVLVADGVADAALDALAVRGVADAAGQVPQVVTPSAAAVSAAGRRQRHLLDPAQHLDDGRRAVDDLAGRARAAHLHRVAAAELDRIHAERGRELVHLRLVAERGLDGAEAAHRAARRVVGVDAVGVDVHVRHDVRPGAHRAGVADHGRRARRVRAAVQVDARP